jgi:hypothetical protein
MTTALLFITSACMLHFNGGVPKPLLDKAYNESGAERVVQALDERFLNEEIRLYGGNLAIGAQVLFQQKLVLSTTF